MRLDSAVSVWRQIHGRMQTDPGMHNNNIIHLPNNLPDVIYGDVTRICEWVAKRTPYIEAFDVFDQNTQTIGFTKNNRIVCGVVYTDYRGRDIQMHCACDDPSVWNRENIGICFHYPFEQLGVIRITAPVPSTYVRALSINQRLGFKVEGVLRNFIETDVDVVLLGMLRHECKWI